MRRLPVAADRFRAVDAEQPEDPLRQANGVGHDGEPAAIDVEVAPPQREQLAVAQAGAEHEHPQRLELVVGGGGQDGPRLLGRTRPPSSGGVYVNHLGAEGDERVRDAYGVNLARLKKVKATYDPHNFFRLNQNVEPVAT